MIKMMKICTLLIVLVGLLVSGSVFSKPYVYGGYGYANFTDTDKDKLKFTSTAYPFKVAVGNRFGHLEFEIFGRFGKFTGDITHDNVKNSIIHDEKTFGAGIGIYTIPQLRLSVGYAFYQVSEKLKNNVSDIQLADIQEKYNLIDESTSGFYAGVDIHLLTLWKMKVLFSGNYYAYTSVGGKSLEAMIGIKIPFGGGGRSSGFNPLKSMSER